MVWDRFWMDLMDIGWIYACLIDFDGFWMYVWKVFGGNSDVLGKVMDGCFMDVWRMSAA